MRSWKSRWLDSLLLLVCVLWFGGAQAETIALRDVEFDRPAATRLQVYE